MDDRLREVEMKIARLETQMEAMAEIKESVIHIRTCMNRLTATRAAEAAAEGRARANATKLWIGVGTIVVGAAVVQMLG